jgi:hypothetical protein
MLKGLRGNGPVRPRSRVKLGERARGVRIGQRLELAGFGARTPAPGAQHLDGHRLRKPRQQRPATGARRRGLRANESEGPLAPR